jgi:hypothetical protein
VGWLQRRGSYFYVLDAFIASIIIISTLVLLLSSHLTQLPPTEAFYTGEDFLDTIGATKTQELDDPTVRDWIAQKVINTTSMPLLDQLAVFEVTGDTVRAAQLAAILGSRTPPNVDIEILLNGNSRYARQAIAQSEAATLLSAKRIIIVTKNPMENYDPVVVEVRTWQ